MQWKKSWGDERSQYEDAWAQIVQVFGRSQIAIQRRTPASSSIKIPRTYVVDTECQNIPESILSNQTQISLLEVHLLLSPNIMALLSMLLLHVYVLVLPSLQAHITENTYARVKTPISLMLRPTLLWRMEAWLEVSLVLLSTLIIINAYMRAGVKMKEGDENWEDEIFFK